MTIRARLGRGALAAGWLAAAVLAGGCSAAEQARRQLARAEKYAAQGKHAAALVEYRHVLRRDPTNRVALSRAGQICFETGDLRQAYPLLRRACELDPDDLDARLKLGALYVLGGRREDGRQEAEYVLSRAPERLEALLLLTDAAATPAAAQQVLEILRQKQERLGGQALFHLAVGNLQLRLNRPAEAETALREAERLDPASAQVQQALGRLHRVQGNLAAAESAFRRASELAPPESAARLQLARFYLEQSRTNEAVSVLEEALKRKADQPATLLLLAEIDLAGRQPAAAREKLDRILRAHHDHVSALLLRAQTYVAEGQREQALAECDRLVQRMPALPQARHQRAALLWAKGEAAKAEADWREAVRCDPDFAPARLALAELQLRAGQPAQAAQGLEEFLARPPGPEAETTRAKLMLATAYRLQRAPEKAERLYREAAQARPADAQLRHLLGLALLEQGRTAEAEQAFEEALKLAPEFVLPLAQIVGQRLRARQADEALRRAQRQLEAAPRAAPLWYLLAMVRLARQEPNEAEQALRKVIEIEPKHSGAYLALSRLYASTGKESEALAKLEAALQANPRDLVSLVAVGAVYQKRGETDKARARYEEALKLKPDFAAAANNLATIYAETDLERAYALARQAREAAPDDPYVADTLGWILQRRGEYRRALPLLRESAEKLPEHPEVLYHLGRTWAMLGDEGAATEALLKALMGAVPFAEAEAAGRLLDLLSTNPETADAEKTWAQLQEALAKTPDDLFLLWRAGQFAARRGDSAAARALLEKARKRDAGFVPAAVALAELYNGPLAQPRQALELAEQAVEAAPGAPQPAATLGWIAFRQRDYPRAFNLLQEAKQRRPDSAVIAVRAAWTAYAMGRTEQAAEDMRRALQNAPAPAERREAERFLEFVAPANEGPTPEAVQRALAEDPTYLPALMRRAALEEQRGDRAAAIKTCEALTAQYPFFAPAFRQLLLLHAAGETATEAAMAVGRKARELLPLDPQVAKALGILAQRRRDYEGSARLLQEAARSLTNDAEVVFFQGLAAKQTGKPEEARALLRRALELQADAPWRAQAQAALDAL